jgi:hypothetical protein
MTKRILQELHKWCNGDSILVIGLSGLLLRLYCPFMVECIKDDTGLHKGALYQVERIAINRQLVLIFIINSRPYFYHHFSILGK